MRTHDTSRRSGRARRLHLVRDGEGHAPYGSGRERRRPQGVCDRFMASPHAAGLHVGDVELVVCLLEHARDVGPAGALCWTAAMVQDLRVGAVDPGPAFRAADPARVVVVLRRLVRFGHAAIAAPAASTALTLRAIDAWAAVLDGDVLVLPAGRDVVGHAPVGTGGGAARFLGARPDRRRRPLHGAAAVTPVTAAAAAAAAAELERLAERVGGAAVLDALDGDPLPDEPLGLDGLTPAVAGLVGRVGELVDRVCAEVLDVEHRTAARRLLRDVALAGPDALLRSPRADTAASAVLWVVGRANDTFVHPPNEPSLRSVNQLLGLPSASSSRGWTFMRLLGGPVPGSGPDWSLGSVRHLTSSRRRALIAARDDLRRRAASRGPGVNSSRPGS